MSEVSKKLWKKFVEEFDTADLPNQEYLEYQLQRLSELKILYKEKSENPKLKPKDRAKARDLQMATEGMLTGIKFSISYWLHKDKDLIEMENLKGSEEDQIVKDIQ